MLADEVQTGGAAPALCARLLEGVEQVVTAVLRCAAGSMTPLRARSSACAHARLGAAHDSVTPRPQLALVSRDAEHDR